MLVAELHLTQDNVNKQMMLFQLQALECLKGLRVADN
jgi:hypothetical protein